ncbi:MAG: hypothetical protein ACOY0T_37705 [Myxococcota bacterium]
MTNVEKEELFLNLFCSPTKGAWRVHLGPTWLPPYLLRFFDAEGEAYPVFLDFEELDRQVQKHGAVVEKRVAKTGGTELTARGASAKVVANWLATAFASSAYVPPSAQNKVAR